MSTNFADIFLQQTQIFYIHFPLSVFCQLWYSIDGRRNVLRFLGGLPMANDFTLHLALIHIIVFNHL